MELRRPTRESGPETDSGVGARGRLWGQGRGLTSPCLHQLPCPLTLTWHDQPHQMAPAPETVRLRFRPLKGAHYHSMAEPCLSPIAEGDTCPQKATPL